MQERYDYIIVGAGLCGLVLAKELSQKNKRVLILERGGYIRNLGSIMYVAPFYDKIGLAKSRQGVINLRVLGVGGTSVVSCGNAVEFPEEETKKIGIDFSSEIESSKKECNVSTDHVIGRASKRIMEEANRLGYGMRSMPKLHLKKCVSCGNCIWGCAHQNKWSSIDFLKDINTKNIQIITSFNVRKVTSSNSKALGIEGTRNLNPKKYLAEKIILAAGGLGTPVILQNSGIEEAGKNLFLDLFNIIYGLNEQYNQAKELTMSVVCDKFHKNEGFILSPLVDSSIGLLACIDLKYIGNVFRLNNLMGLMNKIKDENMGRVYPNGAFDKTPTANDRKKLNKGAEVAKEILIQCGVRPKSIFVTRPRGAHPGGTAAIGKVVDKNLETRIKNLFVCDASILPEAPGLPPILTLVAISKWFVKNILEK